MWNISMMANAFLKLMWNQNDGKQWNEKKILIINYHWNISNHNVFKSESWFNMAACHTLSDNVLIIDDPMIKSIVEN